MDLTRPVTYRGASLNNATPTVGRLGLTGCILEQADVRAIQYVGAGEKRRLDDGFPDTIEPYLGLHKFVLSGTVFGQTRGETYDRLQVLKEAFNPVKALLQSPSTKGFVPFAFTNTFPRTVNCRPMGLTYKYDATRAGTNAKLAGMEDAVGLGIRWTAELLVNTAELLDCGEWPPEPAPTGPDYYPIPGDRVGPSGLLCTVGGYALPWCSGTGDGALVAGPITTVPSGTPSIEMVKLYDDATYRFAYTFDHEHGPTVPGDNDLGAAVGPGALGAFVVSTTNPQHSSTRFIAGHESGLPLWLPTAVDSVTFEATTGDAGDPCVPLWVFEGAGVFAYNNVGSSATCLVTYVSGADPRFVGLPPCPDPDWPG